MAPARLLWFARHEARLGWRDLAATIGRGRRRGWIVTAVAAGFFAVFLHAVAVVMVAPFATLGPEPDKVTLTVVTACAWLSAFVMLSQSMEAVTRAFYTRGDLDLVLSSPVPTTHVFAVRIAMLALSNALAAMLLASPFVDVLVWHGGARWLAGFGAAAATGIAAAAAAVALTMGLFAVLGPVRTRLAAQIVAALIGAAFAIGVQAAAIVFYGDTSRLSVLTSSALVDHAPEPGSLLWIPARAILGDLSALAVCLGAALAALAAAIVYAAPRLASRVAAASGAAAAQGRRSRRRPFRPRGLAAALRGKEWRLLARDPWLVSQTLLQVLYLLPAALLLWRRFGQGADALAVLVPVLVMSAGQLAGGLAWLTISGEDAPDLIATAPVTTGQVLRAKVESVLGAVALVFTPLTAAIALASPVTGVVAAVGIVLSALSAIGIQLSFRAQARQNRLRRRHASSRLATFAEALSSISWSVCATLAAQGYWRLVPPMLVITALVLLGARLVSPRAIQA